jgi:hypothetical protein
MSEVKVNKISPRTNCGTTQLGDAGDTITVTGDLKSNSLKSASGSTITLGQSGDTIQLGCGASQTGFGRTGTVDWDTTAKTASFTAVSGNGYFVNTTSGAITMTLPASPSAGDIVSVKDYAGTFATNNLTIARNGSNLDGSAGDAVRSTDNESLTLVYVDGTQGWKSVEEGTGFVGESFMVATGGTITTCGNCKIHTFTSPGTFCVSTIASCSANNQVSYVVVAGGGGGGKSGGGGAGAGGFREDKSPVTPYTASPLEGAGPITVTATSFPITVGAGGAGLAPPSPLAQGVSGSNSVFSTITSAGGSGGGSSPQCGSALVGGGSGGGGRANQANPVAAGNTPPVSPPQGNQGGIGGPANAGGGGGGASASGCNASGRCAGDGADGVSTSITGSSVTRAGGGGGGTDQGTPTPGSPGDGGVGGNGGGGRGGIGTSPSGPSFGVNGTTNTGGGGGGGSNTPAFPSNPTASGGSGGSGIVIIRYKFQ